MKKITLESMEGEDCNTLQMLVDGVEVEGTYSDIPYESRDAWTVYNILKCLSDLGIILLETDSTIVEWYADKPAPQCGENPASPGSANAQTGWQHWNKPLQTFCKNEFPGIPPGELNTVNR